MDLHRYDLEVPAADLVRDARRATCDWDWSRGAWGHALSLPRYADLHPLRRYSYQNHPCTGRLAALPAFARIFAALLCEKMSFRLLRRGAGTAYGWHTDRWKGRGVVRFQVPILGTDSAFLVTTDYKNVDDVRGRALDLTVPAGLAQFREQSGAHAQVHRMDCGQLYYFDTSRAHTLVNPGPEDRVTLSFDLVANDWLRERFPAIRAETGDGALQPLPRPGALGRALARAAATLHPLRNRARRLLAFPA